MKSKGIEMHVWASQAYSTHTEDSPDMVLAFEGSQSVREPKSWPVTSSCPERQVELGPRPGDIHEVLSLSLASLNPDLEVGGWSVWGQGVKVAALIPV